MDNLNQYELAPEPSSPNIFVITGITDRKRDPSGKSDQGIPIISMFSGMKQLRLMLEHKGFEYHEFCDLPESVGLIPSNSRLGIIMNYASVTKIPDFVGKKVLCEKKMTQKGNSKWTIVGSCNSELESKILEGEKVSKQQSLKTG